MYLGYSFLIEFCPGIRFRFLVRFLPKPDPSIKEHVTYGLALNLPGVIPTDETLFFPKVQYRFHLLTYQRKFYSALPYLALSIFLSAVSFDRLGLCGFRSQLIIHL